MNTEYLKLNKSCVLNVVIAFGYLFFFRPQRYISASFIDSTVVLGAALTIIVCCSSRKLRILSRNILRIHNVIAVLLCLVLILYAFVITVCKGIYDYSVCKTLIHQLVYIYIGILYYSYLSWTGNKDYYMEYFILAYFAQSIIQLLATLFPSISEFTNIFKSESTIILKNQYLGFRLNAIAGSLAFGLAIGYSLILLYFVMRWNEIKIYGNARKTIIFIFLLIGAILAGRIAILLFIVGGTLFLALKHQWKMVIRFRRVKIKRKAFIVTFLIGICLVILLSFWQKIQDVIVSQYADVWNVFIGWLNKSVAYFSFDDSSFLSDQFTKVLEVRDPLFGDGRSVTSSGMNYLILDAGYIRAIAYGGFVWLVMLLLYQNYYLAAGNRRKYEYIVILTVLLLGTIKGDLIGIGICSQLILFIVYMDNCDRKRIST